MPYITQNERKKLDENIDNLVVDITNEGQLNYVIYRLCRQKMYDWKISYKTLNKILGVFECCKQEFLRRQVFPYEDMKLTQNGDIK